MRGPPPAPDSYGRVAPIYDRLFESTNRGLRVAGLRAFRPALGMAVLDVGCGTGSQLELYQRYECRLFGLDASPAMLERARKRLGAAARLERGDARSLPYPDRNFDLVMSTLMLHEMDAEERLDMLREVRRVLKADGRALFIDFHTGPYEPIQGWFSRLVILAVEFAAGREHFRNHRQFLRTGGLPGLAAQNRFEVRKQYILGGGNFAVQLSTPA
jgi:ubiquinone/menaquinone biosynthesis C-methylase UbiE